ncbi:MAG: amidohydrolase [Bacteroidetes bacterium]|jgi:imidazolonepropionase-like amidohydrolase|nr:amidohydrolase [Bacteroidota bacterium]
MMKNKLLLVMCLLGFIRAAAQPTFPTNGAPFNVHSTYAYINANIYVDYETLIKNGVLLCKDGKILFAGVKTEIPKGAVVIDLKGKFIYPSFIDIYSDYGMPENKGSARHHREAPQMESSVKGAYGWNQAIKPEVEAIKAFVHNKEKAEEYKKQGFGTVLTCQKDGIVRGAGALVNLDDSKENLSIVKDRCAGYYSLSKGSSTQDYPSSLTGCIALLRQTHYDAQWYKSNVNKTEYNISLEAFNKLQELPSVIETNDKYNAARAAKIGKEFNVKYIIKAGGNEYQRINDIANSGLKYILPLNFPDAYDVEDPYDAENISLAELKHWELAPTNPAEFEKNGVPFCFTLSDLKNKGDFLKNLRKAIQYGLTEQAALKALTANPALFVNVYDKAGALKKDFYANFFISNKSIFEDDAVILQHIISGEPDTYSELNPSDIRGNYKLTIDSKTYDVKFSGDVHKPNASVKVDTSKKNANYNFNNNLISFSFSLDSVTTYRLSGNYNPADKSFNGNGQAPNGNWFSFTMTYVSAADTAAKKPNPKTADLNLGKVIYPFNAYGEPLPEGKGFFKDNWNKFKNRYSAILIKDATVWTNNGDSVLTDYDVYVVEGKIVRVAPNIDAPKLAFAKIINGKGMHLTPGIIDEHSHIAISHGVNEGAQASSAEVRMGDVINPDDVNIYRQLSGGVTCAQLLHGSANPIGGQSAIIKLRWGHSAEDMKYEKADGFIKFALGENVKQSNWGDHNTVRFPQSRMGVEQVYNDFFSRAKEYNKSFMDFAKLTPKDIEKGKIASPRKDLELEALAEILNTKRFITCHSYVQSEINMLMHIADSFGFKVNTFTHILEGYKVADKMKAHGVTASTFSDWWAYKNEVMDAIPYNAAILTKMGVNTCINSDDAEMARRLNQEAAKSVKYGAATESEALKMVTLNPAKALHIDDKVGTIQAGKVADLVLWTDHPLSVYAKADKTIIDGQIYFDREEDAKLREYIKTERARIIAKLLKEKQKGERTVRHHSKQPRLYHCNTIEGVSEEETGVR